MQLNVRPLDFLPTSNYPTIMKSEPTSQSVNIPRRNFIGGLATASSAFAIPAAMVTE